MELDIRMVIRRQRERLAGLLGGPMHDLAAAISGVMNDRQIVEALLREALPLLANCKHLFALDAHGRQFVDNINVHGNDPSYLGRDRMDRPYMQDILGTTDFRLSEAYISRNRKKPMLTAVQVIRAPNHEHIGFLGADYDLRSLPAIEESYKESNVWRQLKGDPAIRGGLFAQTRVESMMDPYLDDVLALMTELVTEHGVFHSKLHFSGSRATIWLTDNPFEYRILGIDELVAPDTCLAYPRRPYTERAVVPPDAIGPIMEMFRELRFADETIYLRTGSLNICNGLVALNFSCDGSHYIPYREFLDRGMHLWLGTAVC